MFYRSERLFLRPAWPEDWKALLGGISNQEVVCNLATAPWPYDAQSAHDFLAKPQDPAHPNFLLTRPGAQGSTVVGMCGLGAGSDNRLELGYWIARPYWGRGYATEAAKAVLEIARMLGHQQIVAGHYLDNPASGKVLRKVGFVPTGRVEPSYCLARKNDVECAYYTCDLASGDLVRSDLAMNDLTAGSLAPREYMPKRAA